MLSDLSLCEYFSLQLGQFLDVTETAQLDAFARMTFQNYRTEHEVRIFSISSKNMSLKMMFPFINW